LCSDEDSRADIRDAGGVELLVGLLDGPSVKVAKQSCGALLNLAVEDEGKDLIRDAGAIPKVLTVGRKRRKEGFIIVRVWKWFYAQHEC